MKTRILRVLGFTAFLFLGFSAVSNAQVTSTRSSNETRPQDVVRAQEAVNEVLLKSGTSFKEGLLAYEDGRRPDAARKFDKSVEEFLISTLNIQRETKLQNCYNQLIETIYRIEFPSDNQLPQVRNLSLTCGWSNIDATLADKIATIAKNSLVRQMGP